MLVDPVITKLAADVPNLAYRIGKAAELAGLVERDARPQALPAAFVVSSGITGGELQLQSGASAQHYRETISVVLCAEAAGDATGAIGLTDIEALKDQAILSLIGFAPLNAGWVFSLERGRLSGLAGMVIYQLDFSINNRVEKIA